LLKFPSLMETTLAHAALYLLLKMHIFVAWGKTMLDVSGFLLTAENCYYAEGCWDFEVELP
jgi:hypothetical protein